MPATAIAILATLLAADQVASPPPDANDADKALRVLADQLQRAVSSMDVKSLVAVVAEDGLSCVDNHVAKPEVQANLVAKTGSTYEALFDTARLRARVAKWGPPPPEMIWAGGRPRCRSPRL
jgi:hypothetical protein